VNVNSIVESGWPDWLALMLVFVVIFILGGPGMRQAVRLTMRYGPRGKSRDCIAKLFGIREKSN
jgi:hypothetical protein